MVDWIVFNHAKDLPRRKYNSQFCNYISNYVKPLEKSPKTKHNNIEIFYILPKKIKFDSENTDKKSKERKMFYIAVCDDEEYFRKREKQLIEKYMQLKDYKYRIDVFQSGRELLELDSKLSQFDMIFLDINMEEIDGIETAREIRKITKNTYIVFVTAFITYALEGYKVDAVRYLLKDDECLEKAVNECLETIVYKMNYEEHKTTFAFQEGEKTIRIEDIVYIESNLHKLIFHMSGNIKYTMYAKLDELSDSLRETGFCRIHKSYLVNFRYVENVERYKAELIDGRSLAISKAKYLETKNEFVSFRGEI
jgi:DNA-binding LytR/AlgR family response regulator